MNAIRRFVFPSTIVAASFSFSVMITSLGCQGISPTSTTPASKTLVSVSVTPASQSVVVGASQQFSATANYSDNTTADVSATATWTSATPSVATVSASGLAKAVAAGSTTITASYSGMQGTTTLTVGAVTKTVTSIAVSPANPSIGIGATQQFTATATYSDGSTGNVSSSATWTSGTTSVATINSSGLATAVSVGSSTITATLSGVSGTTSLTVNNVVKVVVSPASAQVKPSGQQLFTATVTGTTTTTVTWSVDEVPGGNATTGMISSGGQYTAPSAVGGHTVTATSTADPSASGSASVTVLNASQAAVLTYHNDDTRDGAFLEEVNLTPSNVNSTQFGKLLSYPVDGQAYAQPLYMAGLTIAGGSHDVVFVETQNNSVYAFDADATSSASAQTFWQVSLGPSVPKGDLGGVNPNVGILSTPVIDATTNTMFLVVETSKTGPNGTPFFLHALDVTTGKDRSGSPVAINATYNGDTMEPSCYQRMGLALDPLTNLIYMAFGDCTHGWVLAYDKTSLAQKAVFDDTNGSDGGGFWESGGAPAVDDQTGEVYLMSGVDFGDNVNIGYNDSFLRLNATSLAVEDYFTPDNNATLAQHDADLGSGGNILVPGSVSTPNVTLGGGKDGNVFVVNRDNMGKFNGNSNNVLQTVQICNDPDNNIFSTPVYWNGTIYFHCNNNVISAYSWNANTTQMSTTPTSKGSTTFSMHGATPALSANGAMNGIIWEIDNSAYSDSLGVPQGPSVLHAYSATNLATELYNSAQSGSRDTAGQALKFTVPTIANGKVFVPTSNELDIYGLLP